ncbi:cupin domain-containing protein [Desulfohalovibrio reitneri]|uniref:cupin domain-containing protein n=1 Tax=Desulfohalovibrio reitneri TaxID=1307759 RepID=UPI0004A6D0AC|nr:cupin domain-containing protein [Desulfohalovibrio reitneri]
MRKVNLDEAFGRIEEQWSPRVAAELNGQMVKLARIQGEFPWHAHDGEEEMFLVYSGSMVLESSEGNVALGPGELAVVPRGVEHRPVAEEECLIVLFEPAGTSNTGGETNEYTTEAKPL